MLLLTSFACAALLLAALGVYGSMAYSVQQRTRELGVRLALGATPPQVRAMVAAQGMATALPGIGIGIVAALGLARVMAGLLYGVSARDARVFIGVAVTLGSAALASVWFPARRASRVDPVIALRAE